LNALQKKLLAIVLEIDKVCRKHDIIYFLGGGTALGAVRHKGFLPWDDDADLYITRDNWNKLKDILPIELPQHLTLVTNETHSLYRNPLCRIIDENTAMFYKTRVADETPHGVQVEFFILDPIPNSEKERQIYFRNRWLYIELLAPYFLLANDRLDRKQINIKKYFVKRFQSRLIGETAILNKLSKKIFEHKIEDCNSVVLRWGQRVIIYNKKIFEQATYVDFEDIQLPVSAKVIEQLRIDYGENWMIIPSNNEQITHFSWTDLNTSYLEHMNYIHNSIDLTLFRKNLLQRKIRNVLRYHFNDVMKKEILKLEYISQQLSLNKTISCINNLNELYQNEQYAKICEIFENYILFQSSATMTKSNSFLEIEDKVLEYILTSVIYIGKFALADKILKIRKKHNQLTKKLIEIELLINSVSEINLYKYNKNLIEMKAKIVTLAEKYPNQPDVSLAFYEVLLIENSEMDTLLIRLEKMLNNKAFNGEVLYLIGLYYLNFKNFTTAREKFIQARNITNNGITLLKINEVITSIDNITEGEKCD